MTKKKQSHDDDDTELEGAAVLDECCKELEECRRQLEAPRAGGGLEAGDAKAIDPATVLTIITTVLKLIEWFKNRKNG